MRDMAGYYPKYTITDNRTGVDVKEPTFTFKQSDPHTAEVMRFYAAIIRDENELLANDVTRIFVETEVEGNG